MRGAFELQREVDELISEKIDESFDDTINDRKIAFHVELCELANEVGFFKYWKLSHVRSHDKIKDEWADCLAFLNSISLSMDIDSELIDDLIGIDFTKGVNIEFHFQKLMFNKLYDYVDIESAYKDLFRLGCRMGFSISELFEAYRLKTNENIRRAKEGY
jgi:dimeric dUTPase (all-alpha-NTP-PPase superfamily)